MVLALHLGQVFENSFQGRGKKGLRSGREADFLLQDAGRICRRVC
jgi:hypothetical protein